MSENIEPLKLPLHPIIRTRLITLMGKNETLQYEIEKLRAALQTTRRDALEEAAQLAKQTAAVLSNPSARDALNYVAATILELGEKE